MHIEISSRDVGCFGIAWYILLVEHRAHLSSTAQARYPPESALHLANKLGNV